MIYTYTVCRNR